MSTTYHAFQPCIEVNGDNGCAICGNKENESPHVNFPKEETVMSTFNINKCNVNVNGHQCKNNRKSGCTVVALGGELIFMCQQHYDQAHRNMIKGVLPAGASPIVYHYMGIKPVSNDFITCPGCGGESNIQTNVTCGICGCAGIIPKEKENTMSRMREQILEELDNAKKRMQEFRDHPYTESAIAYGDAVGDVIEQLESELKEITTMTTTSEIHVEGLMAAIEHAKATGFHGKLNKVEGTNTYVFPTSNTLPEIPNITNKEETMTTTTTTTPTTNGKLHIKCGYCHEYHDTLDAVAACGGKTRIAGAELQKNTPFFSSFKTKEGAWMGKFWLPTHTLAQECINFYGIRTYSPAKNKHGFWVFIHPSLAKDKGDFMHLIAAYKLRHQQNNA